jgi:hypothetical protein
LYGAFIIKPSILKLNHSAGWSVALVHLDSNENPFDVYNKSEEGNLIWINENSIETDDSILFLADPFLVEYNDSIFLFIETQIVGRGAYITSFYIPINSSEPVYMGVALKESFHLSYPQVLRINNQYLMIPESQRGDSSFVYTCKKMPLEWERVGFIYPGRIKDPTLLPVNDTAGYLYYAYKGQLFKQDYVYSQDKFILDKTEYLKTGTTFRPGGKPFSLSNQWYIPLQDNSAGYGTALYAYQIDEFGKTKSSKTARLLLSASNKHEAFNAGMHHMCVLELSNGKKLVAIDGNNLVKKQRYFDIQFFLKYTYLKIWDSFVGNKSQPYYPFND